MNNVLKELVKKHFNLVDAPAVEEQVEEQVEMSEEVVVEETTATEVATEQVFGEIKTADGQLTLTYEGEELAVGLPIFVITEDGNIPAPDGEHQLEGGVVIETEGGSIVEIATVEEETPEIVDETEAGQYPKEEMGEDFAEEIISAFSEIVKPMMETMQNEINELKEKFNQTEQRVETFAKSPAAERTKAEIKNRNTVKTSVDYNPLDENKKAQFERLLKIRNKK